MKEFIKVIEDLTELFRNLTEMGNMKVQAAKEHRVAMLDSCMIKEQALVLNLKGLEKKREACLVRLGYEGKSFREILEIVPEEERVILKPIFEEFSRQVRIFKQVNEDVVTLIKINQRKLSKQLKDLNIDEEELREYGSEIIQIRYKG